MSSSSRHSHKRRSAMALTPRQLSVLVMASLATSSLWAAAAGPAGPADPAAPASPMEAEFQTNFLSTGTDVDLSRFSKGNVVMPGDYRVDLTINNNWIGREDVQFKMIDGHASAVPCFDRASLQQYGVDLDKVARGQGNRTPEEIAAHRVPDGDLCGDLSRYIPQATVNYDPTVQALTITVPQLYMNNHARGYVDPSQWDRGINAGVLGYNFSASRSSGVYESTQAYLGLNAGINLGDWHLRHQGSLLWSNPGRKTYSNIATYAQRDIPSIKSQLVIGDNFTSGVVADSFRVRGVSLYSDPRMYPQSQQGYAPTIRGVAETNARVTVRQRGYVIYETTVAPGPFVIDDLFPTGYGGDLEVTVTEADGRKNTFLVPYAAVPQLVRPGVTLYGFTAGQLEQTGTGDEKPWVAQATWQHGFNNTFTGFAGATASTGYTQLLGGTAINTNIGAFAVSLAGAHTALPAMTGNRNHTGASLGLTYSKNVSDTGTNLSLAAYRFSSSGYMGLLDAVTARDLIRHGEGLDQLTRQRSRLDLTLNQNIGNGQLFVSGSTMDYWGGSGRTTSYSLGYSNTFKSVSWSLSAQRSRTLASSYQNPNDYSQLADDVFYGAGRIPGANQTVPGITDNRIMLSMSMPLGSSSHAPTFNTLMTHDTGSTPGTGIQAGINGTAGANNQVTYGVSGNRTIAQNSSSTYFNANAGYQSSFANVASGYSRTGNSNQVSVSANGGVVVHGGGVTFSQQMGDTIGLIDAPGAGGALVGSASNVHVDKAGYAVVPYLTPYQANNITLDPKGMSDDTEIQNTNLMVAPRMGAVVKLKYQTDSARAVIIKAQQASGAPLPFAADVLDAKGKSVGNVGQGGKVFVRGIADHGSLVIKWGDAAGDRCVIDYQLPPEKADAQNATVIESVCRPQGSALQPSSSGIQNAPAISPATSFNESATKQWLLWDKQQHQSLASLTQIYAGVIAHPNGQDVLGKDAAMSFGRV